MIVYIIRPEDDSGLLKIGISKQPLKRIAQLQTGHPKRLRFCRVFHCQSETQAREIERSLHTEIGLNSSGGTEWVHGNKYQLAVRAWKKGYLKPKALTQTPMLWNFLKYARSGTHEELVNYLRIIS